MIKKFWIHNYKLLLIFLISGFIFYPSLFVFYTNDDFFHLVLAKTNDLIGFFSFFNFFKPPANWGFYRPLTTQLFYFTSWKFFDLNPLPLHMISFIAFFFTIYLVYRLALEILDNESSSFLAALLYGISATHFGHLYFLGAFQEIGMTVFVLLGVLFFIFYFKKGSRKYYLFSFVSFIFGLMSKETAVVIPFVIALSYFYLMISKKIRKRSLSNLLGLLSPFFVVLLFYLYIRFNFFGFASGDSYIWDFSLKRATNTVFWYVLWSLNMPETLVDFVGPGLKINPNLFIYWSKEITPILILFMFELMTIIYLLVLQIIKSKRVERKKGNLVSEFCASWFIITILPVVFLPLHKFSYYLTLPLVAVVIRIAYLLRNREARWQLTAFFVIVWTAISFLTVKMAIETNWITRGEVVAKRTLDFILKNRPQIEGKELVFSDTINDISLPYSPTGVLNNVLSGTNFFLVYFPEMSGKIHYGYTGRIPKEKEYIIVSRSLLGY